MTDPTRVRSKLDRDVVSIEAKLARARACVLELHQEVCDEGGQNFEISDVGKEALRLLDEASVSVRKLERACIDVVKWIEGIHMHKSGFRYRVLLAIRGALKR